MSKENKKENGLTVRVGPYRISVNDLRYKVEVMGLPDVNNHLFKGDPDREVVKEELFYSTFKGLANGILEKQIKRRFKESGLKQVYTAALQELIDEIKKAKEKL